MDPNACLKEIREIISAWRHDEITLDDHGSKLADLIDGLDKWLSNGGFRPRDWKR